MRAVLLPQANNSNNTLPAAPSGQQPPPASVAGQTILGIKVDWGNPVFVAVRAPCAAPARNPLRPGRKPSR